MNNLPENSASDKHLVDRVLRGDNRAFGTIVKNTENLVAQIVFRMIPVAEDRKDIAQDIYLKTFHNLAGFKFQSKLSTWIAQIAYNTCISWVEKKKYTLPGNLDEEENYSSLYGHSKSINESETRISEKELSIILRKEIENLPILYQTLVTLFHHEFQSYEELAMITGLPVGTVKSYLFRARKMLKEKLLSKYKKEAL